MGDVTPPFDGDQADGHADQVETSPLRNGVMHKDQEGLSGSLKDGQAHSD